MSIWSYQAVKEMQYRPELGQYRTYGIQARRKTVRGWEQIELIHDVTREPQLAQKLARLFNLYQFSPIHLRNVFNDKLP